jgi:hypothetical protein
MAESLKLPPLVFLNPKRDGDRELQDKLRRAQRLLGKDRVAAIVREANADGLRFMQEEAKKNLVSSMRAARRPFRTGSLEDAIMDPSNSEADGRGIRFMIDERVRPKVPYYHALEEGYSGGIGRKVPFIFLSQGGRGPNTATRGVTASYSRINAPSAVRSSGIHDDETGRRNNAGRIVGTSKAARTDRVVGSSEIDRLGGSDPNVRAKRLRSGGFIPRRSKVGHGGVRVVTVTRPVPAYHYAQRAGEAFLASGRYGQELDRLFAASGLEAAGARFVLTGR